MTTVPTPTIPYPFEVEAARAHHEELHLRAAEREGRGGIRLIEPGGWHGRGSGFVKCSQCTAAAGSPHEPRRA